jgi:hypothetical protein
MSYLRFISWKVTLSTPSFVPPKKVSTVYFNIINNSKVNWHAICWGILVDKFLNPHVSNKCIEIGTYPHMVNKRWDMPIWWT